MRMALWEHAWPTANGSPTRIVGAVQTLSARSRAERNVAEQPMTALTGGAR